MMTNIPATIAAGYIATSTIGLLLLISLRAQLAITSAQIRLNISRVTIPRIKTIDQCRFGGSGTSCAAGWISEDEYVVTAAGMFPRICATAAQSVIPSL